MKFFYDGNDIYFQNEDGSLVYKDGWLEVPKALGEPITLSKALDFLKQKGGKMPRAYFSYLEGLSCSMALSSGRLLESFQWDEGNFSLSDIRKCLEEISFGVGKLLEETK